MSNQNCSDPSSISNGFYVIAKGFYVGGDQITYYCAFGYELDGTATFTCDGSTGLWGGSTPSCNPGTTASTTTTTTAATTKTSLEWAMVAIPFLVISIVIVVLILLLLLKLLNCHEQCRVYGYYNGETEMVEEGRWYRCWADACYHLDACMHCQTCKTKTIQISDYGSNTLSTDLSIRESKDSITIGSSMSYSTSPVFSNQDDEAVNTGPNLKTLNSWKPKLDSVSEVTTITDL